MKFKNFLGLVFTLNCVGLIAWAGVMIWQEQTSFPTTILKPSAPLWQAEPIVPTAVLSHSSPENQRSTAALMVTASLSATQPADFSSLPEISSYSVLIPPDARRRFGIGVPFPPLETEAVEALELGWYLAWRVLETPNRPQDIEFWQMIRVHEQGFKPDKATLHQVVRANPGTTWLIGNEPDVIWQDNVTPARYAEWYHELYYFLKEADPTCQVAIGGVTQPTPLRLQYLERVMSAYQTRYAEAMPVDVWNIHNFILREARDEWGVDIPPGFTIDQGILYEVEDHDDLDIFTAQLLHFRQWMAERGQRDKPLIVSEYGILMPAEYGFDPERVRKFLYGSYEFMLIAADDQVGYPADDNRLVQRWAWYSLSDNRYPTGNFVDFATGDLTDLGKAHQEFIAHLP
jgi:hypothetical protein